jgi:hypothetical protein
MAFTLLLSVLAAGCGIKWATNKVLSNPDAIAKVGAVYDVLTPRDTTERLVFIQGDSIVVEKSDTIYSYWGLLMPKANDNIFIPSPVGGYQFSDALYRSFEPYKLDTIRITTTRTIRSTDTIIRTLPPDNRAIARLTDTIAIYKALAANLRGSESNYKAQVKTAEKRLIWMAAAILLLGTVIGLLIKFKVKL